MAVVCCRKATAANSAYDLASGQSLAMLELLCLFGGRFLIHPRQQILQSQISGKTLFKRMS